MIIPKPGRRSVYVKKLAGTKVSVSFLLSPNRQENPSVFARIEAMAHWVAMVTSRTVIPAGFVSRGIPYRGQMIQHRKDMVRQRAPVFRQFGSN